MSIGAEDPNNPDAGLWDIMKSMAVGKLGLSQGDSDSDLYEHYSKEDKEYLSCNKNGHAQRSIANAQEHVKHWGSKHAYVQDVQNVNGMIPNGDGTFTCGNYICNAHGIVISEK